MKKICWKSNKKHAILEYLIKEIDPSQDMTRNAITNRAIEISKDLPKDTWINIMEGLPNLPKLEIPIPTAMMVIPDAALENDLTIIENDIKSALGLKVLQPQYEIQLLWINYLNSLKKKTVVVDNRSEIVESDLTGPEMIKKLVQMLLLDRKVDVPIIETIKSELMKWEE